jgi:putative proteasome-type protease
LIGLSLDLPIGNHLTAVASDGTERPLTREVFYVPGSVLRMRVDNTTPLGYGFEPDVDVFFDQNPVFHLESQQVRRVAAEDGPALKTADLTFNAFSLVGGQMAGDSTHRLFLVYPEGNWVEIGPDTPYQIIGASGFGKPILERSLTRTDTMLYGFKVGLLAFDATRLCAADVDFPMDVILYSRGSFNMVEQRYERQDEERHDLHQGHQRGRDGYDAEKRLAPIGQTPSPDGFGAGPPRACSSASRPRSKPPRAMHASKHRSSGASKRRAAHR